MYRSERAPFVSLVPFHYTPPRKSSPLESAASTPDSPNVSLSVAKERQTKQSNNLADNLVHLWALGRLLGDDELQRTTMNELREWYVRKAAQGVTSFVSEQTLAFVDRVTQAEPESQPRHFCVRWAKSMFAIIEVDIQHFSETAPSWLSDKVLFSRPFEPREGRGEDAKKLTRKEKKARVRKAREIATASVNKGNNVRGSD
jgi:hypothetical protein